MHVWHDKNSRATGAKAVTCTSRCQHGYRAQNSFRWPKVCSHRVSNGHKDYWLDRRLSPEVYGVATPRRLTISVLDSCEPDYS